MVIAKGFLDSIKEKKIEVTLVKGVIGATQKQRASIVGLGLNKVNATSALVATDSVIGMIKKVAHLIEVELVK